MINFNKKYDIWWISLLAGIFFFPLLGGVHLFDWDEINFAECAREMIVTGNYARVFIDFEPFWEKPPLFLWMQAASMHLFGVGEYAARFPNAVCGWLSLIVIYKIGDKIHNRNFAWLWVLAYLGSILPHLYFKSGIIDPWFNLFIFSSLYFLIQYYWGKEKGLKQNTIYVAGALLGLAVMTKGPVAVLIILLCVVVYWISVRFKWFLNLWDAFKLFIAMLLVVSLWFGWDMIQHGTAFTEKFIKYQIKLLNTHDAGHSGFIGYHFIVLLLGCFPASIFALGAFKKSTIDLSKEQIDFQKWMKILFWVVLILFTIVQTKIVHYSSLCYLPLTYLAATYLYKISTEKKQIPRWLTTIFISIGSIWALVCLLLPIAGKNIEWIKPFFVNDPFGTANLEAEVVWTWWQLIPGIFLSFLLIYCLLQYRKLEYPKSFIQLFVGMGIFINIVLISFINNIESYSQRAVIDFYKDKVGEKCYIYPDYYTYANLFYSKKQKPTSSNHQNKNWLINGAIDQPVYFIARIHQAKEFEKNNNLTELYRKNGFVFFKRELQ